MPAPFYHVEPAAVDRSVILQAAQREAEVDLIRNIKAPSTYATPFSILLRATWTGPRAGRSHDTVQHMRAVQR